MNYYGFIIVIIVFIQTLSFYFLRGVSWLLAFPTHHSKGSSKLPYLDFYIFLGSSFMEVQIAYFWGDMVYVWFLAVFRRSLLI